MSTQERYEHQVMSPHLRLGAAILVLLIVIAGVVPLIQSFFN